MLILKLTFLLIVANGAPIIARQMLGRRFAMPMDAGIKFFDGSALFGSSKTVRGVLAALISTCIFAHLLGLGWKIGLLVGTMAMLGDLLASFIKRRMKRPVSSQALGLDQIPEALLPMLACKHPLALTYADVAIVVGLFFVLELLLSRLLYKLNIRARPY